MKKQKSVLIGLSGGVDSAVAALLLKQQGYKVIGAFMKCFSSSKILQGECNAAKDKKDAQKIAALLDIPLITLNYEKAYKKHVIDPMFASYKKGLTPNPDALCNKIIKFPLLWKEAKKHKCDYIATGHYIKRTKTKSGFQLQIPRDKTKDQSYFLYDLTQKDLGHSLFPIGEAKLTKEEVRKIAKKHRLTNWDKKGTRGLCFIGKIDMKQFLKQKIKPKPGPVLDKKGNIIGTHQGTAFYTIGERAGPRTGIKINPKYQNKTKKKLYIAEKNTKKNTLTIIPERDKTLTKKEFRIIKTNWIDKNPKNKSKVKIRIRHLGKLHSGKIHENKIILNKPLPDIAEGQSAVIYKKNTMLGGGEIRYI